MTLLGLEVSSFMLVQGVLYGLTYGLLALGLVLIYKSSRVLNFAHGELGVISAVLLERLVNDKDAPYWPTLLLVLALAATVGGASELLLRRLFARPRLLVMVATIGLQQLLFVVGLLSFIQPEVTAARYPVPIDLELAIGSYTLQPQDFLILVVSPLAAVGVALFFGLTPYGLAVRAAAENAESARLGGIWVRRSSTLAWMIAGLLSGVTAVLHGPYQANVYQTALGPGLLVRALTAALIGGMVNLRVAFVAGIGVGVIEQVVFNNWPGGGVAELVMYALLIGALLARSRALRTSDRTEERSSWQQGAATRLPGGGRERRLVGTASAGLLVVAILLLPALLTYSQSFLFSRIFIYAVIALSLTLLTGWAGQLSLGHFGLVAVGAVCTARWSGSLPVPLMLLVAGAVTGIVAVVIGLPALRIRGLFLAVTTIGFAVLMSGYVLGNRRIGLPEPAAQEVPSPQLLGIDFRSDKTFYYLALAVLAIAVLLVTNLRRSGIGRAFIAVRDNETAAAAMGVRVMRTKLTAFAISGFLAGVAGCLLAYVTRRFNTGFFDPYESIVLVTMVVIGGIGSIRGALLGAAYLLGLPALFGYTDVVAFLTSSIGLLVFVLYLPGGLVGVLDGVGDALAGWLRTLRGGRAIEATAAEASP